MSRDREKLVQLASLANRIFIELCMQSHHAVLTQVLKKIQTPILAQNSHIYWPMVDRHNYITLAVTLCKVMELHRVYRSYMPIDLVSRMDAINKDLSNRKIQALRDKCSGHILDQKTGKPLTEGRIEKMLALLVGGRSIEEVRSWYWCVSGNELDGSIAGTLQAIRDRLIGTYAISEEELHGRF